MTTVEKSIDVNVPITTAYNQWTQFEEFPRFMQGVEEVRQLDDKRLHWRADIGGKDKEWDAEITEQEPDRRIAWRSMTGAENSGIVTFQPVDANRTQVTLQIGYEPEGFLESIGDALGFVSRRVEGDLERFKEFVESRGAETGGWRGEIHGGQETSGAAGTSGTSYASTAQTSQSADYTTTGSTTTGGMAGATDYTTTAGTTGTTGTAYDSTVETTRSADYTTTQGSTTDYSTTGTGRAGFQAGTRDIGTEEGELAIPVVEEELRVGTREVESGGVRVDTRVEETPVEEQVTLREERVHVDRRPVDRPASDADFDRVQEGAVEVRERREEAVVDKQARVVEEVVINRDVEERTETIRDTVRRTDVDVDETPGRTSTTSTDLNQTGGTSDRRDNF